MMACGTVLLGARRLLAYMTDVLAWCAFQASIGDSVSIPQSTVQVARRGGGDRGRPLCLNNVMQGP